FSVSPFDATALGVWVAAIIKPGDTRSNIAVGSARQGVPRPHPGSQPARGTREDRGGRIGADRQNARGVPSVYACRSREMGEGRQAERGEAGLMKPESYRGVCAPTVSRRMRRRW